MTDNPNSIVDDYCRGLFARLEEFFIRATGQSSSEFATVDSFVEYWIKISEIENTWSAKDYKALLSLMGLEDGFDAMTPGELKEMCLIVPGIFGVALLGFYVIDNTVQNHYSLDRLDL